MNLDGADPGSALHRPGRCGADETDLYALDQRSIRHAATLGARPNTVWWRVTLRLLLPGMVSGAVLAFARALGEFGATLTFAGSRQGVTRTLPLEIYLQRVDYPDAAIALSLLLVAVAALVVLGLGARRLTGTDPR